MKNLSARFRRRAKWLQNEFVVRRMSRCGIDKRFDSRAKPSCKKTELRINYTNMLIKKGSVDSPG